MSTVPGLPAKGEKGKSKFQSLDINSLYRVSLGESLEPQQKALPRKHGMQSLGKVPSARRPPANLPSLKSEHSGQDPAISLVPSGGAGWGSKGEGGPPPSSTNAQQQQPAPVAATAAAQATVTQASTATPTQQSAAAATVAAPTAQSQALTTSQVLPSVSAVSVSGNSVPSSLPTSQQAAPQQVLPQQTQQQVSRGSGGGGGQEKLWSSLMSGSNSGSGQEGPSFLAHQSPMFQHEFPSLSADQGGKTTTTQDTQYGPGPSLRPQTEGSWMQGGMSRGGAGMPVGTEGGAGSASRPGQPLDGVGGRNNSGPQGPQQQPSGQAGQNAAPLPPQLRGIIPPFMYRGSNFGPGGNGPGGFPANYQGANIPPHGGAAARQPRYPDGARPPPGQRYGPGQGPPPPGQSGRPVDDDTLFSRPIIKEEDLKQLDEITRDNGWATSDDIDYNQKLAFSDDEAQEDDASQQRQGHPRGQARGQQQPQQGQTTDTSKEQEMQSRNRQPQQAQQQQQQQHSDDRRGGRGEPPRAWQGAPPQGQPRMPPEFHRQVSGPQFPSGPGIKVPMFSGPGGPPAPGAMAPGVPPAAASARMMEDEEVWRERRRQQSEDVALAVERAKQRKEEEEKRFKETREAAAKKLQMLEEKMGLASSTQSQQLERSDSREGNTPSPAATSVTQDKPKPSLPSPQPQVTSQQPSLSQQECWASASEEKPSQVAPSQQQQAQQQSQQNQQQQQQEFRSNQQEQHGNTGPNYIQERERERELRKERGDRTNERHEPMPFSQKFSEDLPPRFAKQKQMLLRGPPGQQQPQQGGQQSQVTAPPSNTPPPLLATPVQPPANFEQRWGPQHFSNQGKGVGRRRGGAPDIGDDERPPSRDREALRQDKQRDRHTPEQDTRQDRYGRGGRAHHGNRQQYFEDFRGRSDQDYDRQGREGDDHWQREEWGGEFRAQDQGKDGGKIASSHDTNRDSAERHLPSSVQQDPFEEKENWGSGAMPPPLMGVTDWRAGGDGGKEWGDARPQRPDSRDSKASSRDSRHSGHDKMPLSSSQHQDEKSGSWSMDNYYDKDDKNTDRMSQRKGDERRGAKRGGVVADKADNKESRSELWPREDRSSTTLTTTIIGKSSSSWAEEVERAPQTPSPGLDLPGGTTKLGALLTDPAIKKDDLDSKLDSEEGRGREGKGSRSRGRNRDARSPRNSGGSSSAGWSGYPVFQKSWGRSGSASGASEGRGRGRGGRLHPATASGRANYAWEDESDLSGEELSTSTEPGKDDVSRRARKAPRSPKRGSSVGKKEAPPVIKDEKPPSVIGEQRKPAAEKTTIKPVGTREGFAPRGEPSRRGRGGGGSRPRGGLGRGIDGYGPPAKSPFGPRDDNKKTETKEDEETKTKLGGMVPLSNAISNAARQNKPSAVPPRMQRTRGGEPDRGSRRRGRGRSPNRTPGGGMVKQNSSDGNEECWETTSENSDEERKGGSRRGGGAPRKGAGPVSRPAPTQQFPGPPGGAASQPTNKAPGAEKKNGLGAAVVRPPVQQQQGMPRPTARHSPSPLAGPKKEGSPGLDLKSEADKKQRLEKEKSALDALDISTYAAVTSMVEEQTQQQQLDVDSQQAQYFPFDTTTNGYHHPPPQQQRKKPPTPPITPPTSQPPSIQSNRGGPPSVGRGKMQQASNMIPGPMQGPQGQQRDMKPQSKPGGYDRSRVSKLPPRLAKQKENNRLQKAAAASAMQQHHMPPSDMLDMSIYNMKDGVSAPMNAWEKPLSGSMGTGSPLSGLAPSNSDPCGQLVDQNDGNMGVSGGDMTANKMAREVLGETEAPVQTIIFENTNLRSGVTSDVTFTSMSPPSSGPLTRGLVTQTDEVGSTPLPFCETSPALSEHLQMPLGFNKGEDTADMKLDFAFDSELLSDDKKGSRGSLPHHHGVVSSAPSVSSGSTNSSISPSAAELNLKIASVKKVWENVPAMTTVLEHAGEDGAGQAFVTAGFEQALDPSAYKEQVQGEEGPLPAEVAYSAGQVIVSGSYTVAPGVVTSLSKTDAAAAAATSSNVCKVKPQQQAVMSSGPSPIGHPSPLSPPPFNSSSAQQAHMGYPPVNRSAGVESVSCWQPALGGGATQFGGISAIPSPPTVLFNTSQQMAAAQSGLYGAFQLTDGQARSQFSQFPPFGLGGNNAAANFSQQSLYLQTAPPPPPPPAPASEMYPPPSLSQYRIQPTAAPFGQTQHVTSNPSTVLISTSSNSLMSASVKPSSQQIGAIGSKGGYQTSAPPPPQPSPLYIYDHPAAAGLLSLGGQSFMSSSPQLVQRPGPVQSNVVPTIQPPTSFFSNSAPGQTGYYQTGSSALQPPPHAASALHSAANPYASMSGYAPAQSGNAAAAVGLQSYGSQVSQDTYRMLQMAAAAAAAQQYRSNAVAANYLKNASQPPPQTQQQQQQQDLSGRGLKSPSSAELGVFAANQMQQSSSPKARGGVQNNNKQPSLPSPTLGASQQHQHKFGSYPTANSLGLQQQQQQQGRGGNSGGSRGGMGGQAPRYPNPIQRPPSSYQPQCGVQGGLLGNNPGNVRPRMPANQQQRGGSHGGSKYYSAPVGSGSTNTINKSTEKPAEETNGVSASTGSSPATVTSGTEESTPSPAPSNITVATKPAASTQAESTETTTKEDKPQQAATKVE